MWQARYFIQLLLQLGKAGCSGMGGWGRWAFFGMTTFLQLHQLPMIEGRCMCVHLLQESPTA